MAASPGIEMPSPVGTEDGDTNSDIVLPPSLVNSDEELPALVDGDVELPPATDRCCKIDCMNSFDKGVVETQRASILGLAEKERADAAFQSVRMHVCDKDGLFLTGNIKWSFQGTRCCRPFWEWAHALGHGTVDKMRKLIRDGHTSVLVRAPRVPSATSGVQFRKADAWFFMLHQDLGEPLAISNSAMLDLDEYEVVDTPEHPLWAISTHVEASGSRYVPKRYLNPGCFEDLWLAYQAQTDVANQVSKSTLLKVWHARWSKYLPFRNIGQGKRCRVCAVIDEERVQATSPDERAQVLKNKITHIQEISADRDVSVRGNRVAERDASQPSVDGINQILKVTIDGMDQAKFRTPRNLASSAEWSALWRPQLHVVGCIVHGHLEAYYIMDSSLAKDANMNCTVISKVVDQVLANLDPQFALPRSLIVGADNTTREAKNQHFAGYLAYLVSSEKFEATECQFMQTGHTHNEQDQRFSSVATLLARAPVLEDPEDFASWIREHVVPPRGRKLHVEVLNSTMDFQAWLHGVDVQLAGLAATHIEPDTNHVWRFGRRDMVPDVMTDQAIEVEVMHEAWQGMPSDGRDVVLFVKQYMHTAELTQAPLLVQPYEVAQKLRKGDLRVMLSNQLGERVVREYRKTASALGQPPWNLLKAQEYLNHLCDESEQGLQRAAQELNFLFEYKMKEISLSGFSEGLSKFEGKVPRVVLATAPTAAERRKRGKLRKRPAAASVAELEHAEQGAEQGAEQAADEGEQSQGEQAADEGEAGLAEGGPEDGAAAPVEGGAGQDEAACRTGCSKCRWSHMGCGKCRPWADAGLKGYFRGEGGAVLSPRP